MQHDPIHIVYTFTYGQDARVVVVNVALDDRSLNHVSVELDSCPSWTHLGHRQCEVCPWHESEHSHCPAAVSLVELVREFGELLSFTEVTAEVKTRERTVTTKTTLQRALSSLIGLRMATSGCPILANFKPMARFHLPFASVQETIFRAAGAYFLAQYYRRQHGEPAELDLAGLREIYRLTHEVNHGLSQRLRSISGGDANLNALVILDMFTQHLPWSIDANLSDMEYLFAPYLDGRTESHGA